MNVLIFGCDPAISIAAVEQFTTLGCNVLYTTHQRHLNRISGRFTCLPYDKIESEKLFEEIETFSPDYIFSIIFDEKIPDRLIDLAKYHALNFHPAPLPAIRSGDAWYWSVRLCTESSAVCVHKLTSSWDSGDIALETVVVMSPKETLGSYINKVGREMPSVISAIHTMMLEQSFTFTPQEKDTNNYYPRPRWKDIYIDWQFSANYIERMVRAGNPNLPALTYFRGKEVHINEASVTQHSVDKSSGVIKISGHRLFVATMDNMLEIKVLTIKAVGIFSAENAIELFNMQSGEAFDDIKNVDIYKKMANIAF